MSVEHLLAQQACRDLVLRAAACTDAQDHEGFAELFELDGELVRPGARVLRGREEIVASYRARPAERITRHLVSNTLVELLTQTQARATSCVLLWSGTSTDASGPFGRPAHGRQVVGEFDDLFTLTTAGWRIARREARFVLFKEDGE
ncbi:MAG: nuclear transport factor 2 family protein [Burkholderiaceae bacterium]